MARSSAARAAGLDRRATERAAAAAPDPRPIRRDPDGFDLIAEIKRRSPSEGVLGSGRGPVVLDLARTYEDAGAAAISVLTEPERFDGSIADLRAVSLAVDLPTLRKDFVVDPVQVFEARAAGASGVLLIVRIVPAATLAALVETAARCGLFVLVEAFDERDLAIALEAVERARDLGAVALAGINCRDLASLAVDPATHDRLAARIPDDVDAVAESGLETPADCARVARAGYRAALVGTALVRSDDPARLAQAMIRAGREAVRSEEAG